MPISDVQRQQLIHTAMTKGTGEVGDVAIQLWQPLTSQLISIIGKGGVNALYARSLYLTRKVFPWLAPGDESRSPDGRFIDLKNSLEGQSAIEANKASIMLILTFTNILASLIGEVFTTNILSAAWSDNAMDTDIAGKEFPHE